MPESVQAPFTVTLVTPTHVAEHAPAQRSANGIRFASFGDTELQPADLERMVQAVPAEIAAALTGKLYYFVPLAIGDLREDATADVPGTTPIAPADSDATAAPQPDETLISPIYTVELGDQATCHRNVTLPALSLDGVFISTRLLGDRFALAFEFFINVGHAYVDARGVPAAFADLAWTQALADVRGETSQDAWESRQIAIKGEPSRSAAPTLISRSELRRVSTRSADRLTFTLAPAPEAANSAADASATKATPASLDSSRHDAEPTAARAKANFLESAFSDAIAIYLLSLSVDFDYSELREREYPLLAPLALAERLRLAARLFPPNPSYDFAIRYRKRA